MTFAPDEYLVLHAQIEKQLNLTDWRWHPLPREALDAVLNKTYARVASVAIERALHQYTVVYPTEAGIHVDIRHTNCKLVVKWQHLLRLEDDSELGLGSERRYLSIADKLEKLAKQCRKQAKAVAKKVGRREKEEATIWKSTKRKRASKS